MSARIVASSFAFPSMHACSFISIKKDAVCFQKSLKGAAKFNLQSDLCMRNDYIDRDSLNWKRECWEEDVLHSAYSGLWNLLNAKTLHGFKRSRTRTNWNNLSQEVLEVRIVGGWTTLLNGTVDISDLMGLIPGAWWSFCIRWAR